jgi:hypothetical protein
MKYQLATYRNDAWRPPSALATSAAVPTMVSTTAVTISTTKAAGRSRRYRRA